MKRKVTRQQLLLFGLPVLGLLVGLVGYLGVVSPQKSKASHLASAIDAAQVQLLTAGKPAPPPTPARAAVLFQLTKAMPSDQDVPGVLREIARLAEASSVSFVSVLPSPIVPLNGYGALPLQVGVSGKYPQVLDFLRRMRQQVVVGVHGNVRATGRLFVVNGATLSSADGRSVSATLKLDAFVYGAGLPPVVPSVAPTGAAGSTG